MVPKEVFQERMIRLYLKQAWRESTLHHDEDERQRLKTAFIRLCPGKRSLLLSSSSCKCYYILCSLIIYFIWVHRTQWSYIFWHRRMHEFTKNKHAKKPYVSVKIYIFICICLNGFICSMCISVEKYMREDEKIVYLNNLGFLKSIPPKNSCFLIILVFF